MVLHAKAPPFTIQLRLCKCRLPLPPGPPPPTPAQQEMEALQLLGRLEKSGMRARNFAGMGGDDDGGGHY